MFKLKYLVVLLAVVLLLVGGLATIANAQGTEPEAPEGTIWVTVDGQQIATAPGSTTPLETPQRLKEWQGSDQVTLPASLPVPSFSQNDPEWHDILMQTCGETIGDQGCALTSTAIVFKYYGAVNKNPQQLNSCLGNQACPIYWANAASSCSEDQAAWVDSWTYSCNKVQSMLDAGRPPIVELIKWVNGELWTHYVVVKESNSCDYSQITIVDPWDGESKTLSAYTNNGWTPNSIREFEDVGAPPSVTDLSITGSDTPDPVTTDGMLTYLLTIQNVGEVDADAEVADVLPPNVTVVRVIPSQQEDPCAYDNAHVGCDLGDIAPGNSATVEIVVQVNAGSGTVLTNQADVYDLDDGNDSNDHVTLTTAVISNQADLSIGISDSPDPVIAGNNLTYVLTVHNAGPQAATGVMVSQALPANVVFQAATPSQGTCTGTGPISCALGNLAVGANAQITVVVKVNASASSQLNSTATVTSGTPDPNNGNNADTESTQVIQRANLGLTLVDTPDPVVAGTRLTYTLSINNAGPSNAASVQVTDTWPSGVAYVSAATSQGTCTPNTGTRTLTCTLGTLAVNGNAQITLVTAVNPGTVGTIVDSAGVTSTATDPVLTNNHDTENTTVTQVANLGLTLVDTPDPVIAGTRLTYTLSVNNAGPSNAASVQVTDTWPSGVAYTSVAASQGSCTRNTSLRTITCTLGTLAVNANTQITLVTTVNPATVETLVDTARVASTAADPIPTNNSATQSTSVIKSADLSLVLTSSAFGVNRLGHYYLTVNNLGPSNASTIVVTDTISADLTIVAVSGTDWTCTRVGQIVTCQHPGPAVANASLPTINVTVRPKPAAVPIVDNTASVSSLTVDPVLTNNQAQLTTDVKPLPLADFDGNGYSDIAVWRPSTGTWYRTTLNGDIDNKFPITVVLGMAGDIPVAADYDGNGQTDFAVFRPSKGMWYLLTSDQVGSLTSSEVQFGQKGDIPVPANYNGDGQVDIAVFRPVDGSWHIRYEGQVQPPVLHWGQSGDIPVPADYDGDGSAEPAFFRPSDGGWYVAGNPIVTYLGQAGDIPVPADYNQDGLTEYAVFRPSTGLWDFQQGVSLEFGQSGDIPVPTDYGAEHIEPFHSMMVAVFRPTTGNWYFYNLADPIAWGQLGDIPASARPQYPSTPDLQ